MSTGTTIEWTQVTWNPVTGCDRISAGCEHCYALTLATRLKAMGSAKYQRDGDPRTSGPGFAVTVHPQVLAEPLRWRTGRTVFVNSMSDLFHAHVPVPFLARVFAVMRTAEQHTFQVLTKRAVRMRRTLASDEFRDAYTSALHELAPGLPVDVWPLPNVWLGVSVENADHLDRVDQLRRVEAAVRFVSAEPLLGPLRELDLTGIGWLIAGGESGPHARPVDPAWLRDLRDRCTAAGVPFFFKQWGGRTPKAGGRLLDGRTHDGVPASAFNYATSPRAEANAHTPNINSSPARSPTSNRRQQDPKTTKHGAAKIH